MISFCILSKRFSLKHEELSYAKIVSLTKKSVNFQIFCKFFVKFYELMKVNL